MATVDGNVVSHWKTVLDYSTSQNGYGVTINSTCSFQSIGWGFNTGNMSGNVGAGGNLKGFSGKHFYSGTGQTVKTGFESNSTYHARGQSAYNVTVQAQIVNPGYLAGTSTATATVTIPALEHHTVSYNANGGSGAPGAQTKWYGSVLTLSGTRPSRAGYTFLGWAKSSTGGVAYAPGAQYSSDADATLYAVWKLNYVAPWFTAASAVRTANATATAEDRTGGYVYASFSWKVDTSVTAGNTGKAAKIRYRVSGAANWTDASTSGFAANATTGTVTAHFAAATANAYEVQAYITDSSGRDGSTVYLTRTVAVATIPIDVGAKGMAVGLLAAAPSEGLRIGGKALTVQERDYAPSNGTGKASAVSANGFWFKRGGVCMVWLDGAVPKGIGAWGNAIAATGFPPPATQDLDLNCMVQNTGAGSPVRASITNGGSIYLEGKGGAGIPAGEWVFINGCYPV